MPNQLTASACFTFNPARLNPPAFVQRLCLVFILLSYFQSSILFAQAPQVEFKHLTLEDGLSNNWMKCIMKDSRGFMWFGTSNGLNRYDGVEFRIFKNEIGNPKSIANNTVNTLFEDSKGNIWVGTQSGLSVFDRKTETFYSYHHNPKNPNTIGGTSISRVVEDAKGNIWIGTTNGLDRYYPKQRVFQHFKHNPNDSNSLSNNLIYDIEVDGAGNVWIATRDGGVNMLDVSTNRFSHYRDNNGPGKLSINTAMDLHKDEKGNMWLGAVTGGLYIFNKTTNSFDRVFYYSPDGPAIDDDYVTAITHDSEGRLFIGTDKSVYISNHTKDQFTKFASHNEHIGNMSGSSTRTLFYDHKSNILWVGTENGGLNFISKQSKAFRYFKPAGDNSINRPVFATIEDDEENILLGTFGGGIHVVNKKTGKVSQHIHTNNPNSLLKNEVIALEKDAAGNILVGFYNGGLDLFDKKTKKFLHYLNNPADASSLNGIHVYDIHIDKNGRTWVATDKALNLFNSQAGKFSSFKPIQADPDNDRNNYVRQVIEYNREDLLILTIKSLQIFNTRQKSFSRFMPDLERKVDNMQCVLVDSKANVWVGTNNGLFRMNKDRTSYTLFTEKDGLPSSDISAIIEDNNGNLWISTRTNGLFKFTNAIEDDKSPSILIYSSDDGLQGREFVSRSVYKGSDNIVYFGGQNGLNMFNPGEILGNLHAPPVVITRLKIFNREVAIGKDSPLEKSITETNTITLSYKDNVFSLSFASLNYLSPQKNQYKYILEGFEKDWNYVNNTTTATYTNLNPGVYTFRVKASDNYGVWNDVGTSLTIVVTPPYWQTWWFKALLIVFVVGTLIGFYTIRVGALKRQRLKLEKLVQERTESLAQLTDEERFARQYADRMRAEADKANHAKSVFLATMSHEIRTPMNGVIGCTALLAETTLTEEQQKYTNMIRSSGENLLAVINDILDFSKIESGKMELDEHPFNLRDCVEDVLELFAAKASASGLDLLYEIENDVPLGIVGDSVRLKQVMINLIGNSIKFTEKGEVVINISLSKKEEDTAEILFEVRDTGVGIAEDKIDRLFKSFSQVDSSTTRKYGGTGLGLVISKLLVELMNGTIGVKSIENKGTTFLFSIKALIDKNVGPVNTPGNMDMLAGKRVLVVDDNETNRIILYKQLTQWKMLPVLCASADAGLKELHSNNEFHLVLTDMQMPVMDGVEFTFKLKQKHPHLPVVLITSLGLELARQHADLFRFRLTKPVRQKELLQTIIRVFMQGSTDSFPLHTDKKLSQTFAEKYPLKILVAEDNQVNQMLVIMILKKLGYEVTIAENGSVALEEVRTNYYDIVLMDVQMPVMDGLEATQLIRTTLTNQPVIIATTANAMKEDKEQCLRAGMDDYITKPIQLDELVNMLEKWALHSKKRL